jgi:hypothetical protein
MPPNNPPSNQQPLTSKPASAPEPIPKIPEAAFLNRDEHIVTIVHRSFIGIVFIYLEAFAAVAALLALLFAHSRFCDCVTIFCTFHRYLYLPAKHAPSNRHEPCPNSSKGFICA